MDQLIKTKRCQIQFPVTYGKIEKLVIYLKSKIGQSFSLKLFEGTGFHHSISGICLQSESIQVDAVVNSIEWITGITECKNNWHFLEIVSQCEFEVPLFSNGAVGYVLHNERSKVYGSKTKFLSDYEPFISKTPTVSSSPKIEVYPSQKVYLVEILQDILFVR